MRRADLLSRHPAGDWKGQAYWASLTEKQCETTMTLAKLRNHTLAFGDPWALGSSANIPPVKEANRTFRRCPKKEREREREKK